MKPIIHTVVAKAELIAYVPILLEDYHVEKNEDGFAEINFDRSKVKDQVENYFYANLNCDILKLDWE